MIQTGGPTLPASPSFPAAPCERIGKKEMSDKKYLILTKREVFTRKSQTDTLSYWPSHNQAVFHACILVCFSVITGEFGRAMDSILAKTWSSQNTYIELLIVKNVLWSKWQQIHVARRQYNTLPTKITVNSDSAPLLKNKLSFSKKHFN